MVTDSGDLVVLAVQRKGEDLGETDARWRATRCSSRATWGALDEQLDDPDVLVVDAPDARPPPGRAARAGRARALVVLVGDGRCCS